MRKVSKVNFIVFRLDNSVSRASLENVMFAALFGKARIGQTRVLSFGRNLTNDLWFCETNAPLTELRDQIGSSGGFSELSIVPSISASFMDMILMHMFCCFMYSGESVYWWCFCYLYFIKISLQHRTFQLQLLL